MNNAPHWRTSPPPLNVGPRRDPPTPPAPAPPPPAAAPRFPRLIPRLIPRLVALLAALGVAALGVAAFVLLLTDPNGRAWIWTLAAAMVVMFAVLAAARWGSRPGR